MFQLVFILGAAVLFFHVGNEEYDGRGWFFALLSIALSLLAGYFFDGWIPLLASQGLLFGAMTLYNMTGRKPDRM